MDLRPRQRDQRSTAPAGTVGGAVSGNGSDVMTDEPLSESTMLERQPVP
jgi:hypothetical protein